MHTLTDPGCGLDSLHQTLNSLYDIRRFKVHDKLSQGRVSNACARRDVHTWLSVIAASSWSFNFSILSASISTARNPRKNLLTFPARTVFCCASTNAFTLSNTLQVFSTDAKKPRVSDSQAQGVHACSPLSALGLVQSPALQRGSDGRRNRGLLLRKLNDRVFVRLRLLHRMLVDAIAKSFSWRTSARLQMMTDTSIAPSSPAPATGTNLASGFKASSALATAPRDILQPNVVNRTWAERGPRRGLPVPVQSRPPRYLLV